MAKSRDVRVDTAEVRDAGRSAALAASSAAPAVPVLSPCAGDAVSVQAATGFAERVGAVGLATAATNLSGDAAAARLHGDAEAYDAQDAAGGADLVRGAAPAGTAAPAPDVRAPSLPGPPQLPGVPAGAVPTTGREISALMHGGPGPQGMLAAAAQLDTAATELDQAAAWMQGSDSAVSRGWESDAATAAQTYLSNLRSSYRSQAARARSLASQIRSHVEDFTRARAQIPPPAVFAELERRLQVAYAANAHPAMLGRFSAQIAELHQALGAANRDSVTGYSQYQRTAPIEAASQPQPGTDTSDTAADPARPGGEDTNDSGADFTAADAADPLLDPAAAPGGDLMQTVLPAVLGGVAAAAGGLLGALSGAGQQLQQAGSQLVGGLAQGANAAMTSAMNGKLNDAETGAPEPPGLNGADPAGTGPAPGDTEAASADPAGTGPLSAPAAAPAVAAAAPATFSTSPGPLPSGANAAPLGGAMMPPMMPMAGRPGGGEGADDRRLYPERRMRIETPPNTEPVKRRREARRTRSEQTGDSGA